MTTKQTKESIQEGNQGQEDAMYTRSEFLDMHSKLDTAWKELDDERKKLNKLDIEVANLKDENAKLEQQKQHLLNNFQQLYEFHTKLEDQVLNSQTAITITLGKLAEAIVRNKFIIPESNKQES